MEGRVGHSAAARAPLLLPDCGMLHLSRVLRTSYLQPRPPRPTSPPSPCTQPGAGTGTVEAVAWDARAARLALAVGGAHPAAGTVALYDTRCDPIVSARFIGFMRLGPLAEGGSGAGAGVAAAGGSWAAAAAAEADWEEIQPEEVAEAAGAVGGAAPTSVATTAAAGQRSGATAAVGQRPQLAFLPGFSQGAVLAARQGAVVATVPMYFAA